MFEFLVVHGAVTRHVSFKKIILRARLPRPPRNPIQVGCISHFYDAVFDHVCSIWELEIAWNKEASRTWLKLWWIVWFFFHQDMIKWHAWRLILAESHWYIWYLFQIRQASPDKIGGEIQNAEVQWGAKTLRYRWLSWLHSTDLPLLSYVVHVYPLLSGFLTVLSCRWWSTMLQHPTNTSRCWKDD